MAVRYRIRRSARSAFAPALRRPILSLFRTLALWTVLVGWVSPAGYGQSTEQAALDHFAREILPREGKSRVYFAGVITVIDSNSAWLSKQVVESFYYCKLSRHRSSNEAFRSGNQPNPWPPPTHYVYDSIDIAGTDKTTLDIPKGIKYRPNLSYYRLGTWQANGVQRVWSYLFGEKYNLDVGPAIAYEDHRFVLIKMNRPDLEYGHNFYLLLDSDYTVVDVCSTAWIQ